jgi:MbtH protein
MSIFAMDDAVVHGVVNHADPWSNGSVDRAPSSGWRAVGPSGSKQERIAYIEARWTDMRPLDLRQPVHQERGQ